MKWVVYIGVVVVCFFGGTMLAPTIWWWFVPVPKLEEARAALQVYAQQSPEIFLCDPARNAAFRRAAHGYSAAMHRAGTDWPDYSGRPQPLEDVALIVMAAEIGLLMMPSDLVGKPSSGLAVARLRPTSGDPGAASLGLMKAAARSACPELVAYSSAYVQYELNRLEAQNEMKDARATGDTSRSAAAFQRGMEDGPRRWAEITSLEAAMRAKVSAAQAQ